MASIKDVAERAGVSTATVSHVINNTRYVAELTKQSVFDAMRELDYRPNSVARSLRSRKSKIIGLLVPILESDTSNFFFMSVAHGIEHVLRQHGYNLLVSNSNEDRQTEIDQIRVFNTQLIDGVIIAPANRNLDVLKKEMVDDYPVVCIDRLPDKYQGDSVIVDNEAAMYAAAEYLIERGRHKIGYISSALDVSTTDARYQGFTKALTDFRLTPDPALIQAEEPTFEGGYALAKMLTERSGADALLISDNMMTMGAISYVRQAGIAVPEQLAMIGFDDYKWAEITSPPLSVIKQPAYTLGLEAARTLLNRIEQPALPVMRVVLKPELIIRDSC